MATNLNICSLVTCTLALSIEHVGFVQNYPNNYIWLIKDTN